MKTWKISGINLKNLYVVADCFDDALAMARKINRNYDGGQVVDKREHANNGV